MTKHIDSFSGLHIGQFVGPVSEGKDRRRWQFTVGDGYAVLNAQDVKYLIETLQTSLNKGNKDK